MCQPITWPVSTDGYHIIKWCHDKLCLALNTILSSIYSLHPVTPYDDKDTGPIWLRKCIAACWHQIITWTGSFKKASPYWKLNAYAALQYHERTHFSETHRHSLALKHWLHRNMIFITNVYMAGISMFYAISIIITTCRGITCKIAVNIEGVEMRFCLSMCTFLCRP